MPDVTVSSDVDGFMTAANQAAMRTAIGLGSVNNTSDAAKPISTATQTAINAINDVNVFPSLLDVTGVKANDLVIIEGDKAYRATGPASFVAVMADPTSHTHTTSGIVDNSVTYAKIQDVSAASRLIGRGSGSGAGDPQEISLGSGLSMTGTVLSATASGSSLTVRDIDGAPSLTATTLEFTNGTVSDQGSGVARVTIAGGNETHTGDATGATVLTIAADAVTYAKMQNISAASRLIGRGSASGAGDPQEISIGSGLTMTGTTLSASAAGLAEPLVMPSTVMPALAIDVTKFVNTKSISADSTMTFSAPTPTAGTRTEVRVTTDATARTLTIPSSWSYARNSLITTVLIPASSTLSLWLEYTGSRWEVYGDPVATTGTGNYVLATSPTLVTPVLGIGSYTALRTTEVANIVSANAATITLGSGNHQSLTLAAATGSVTVDFVMPASASAGTLVLLQDDTARDVTWTATGGGTILWAGTQPTWNADAVSSYRVIAWRYDGTRLFLSPTDVFTANS